MHPFFSALRHGHHRHHGHSGHHGHHGHPGESGGHPFARHATGRHRGFWGDGGGQAGPPGGFGDPDDFDGGLRRGRKFSADDLQLLILSLLAERPSHGYEIIKSLDTRTNGFYKPSPGVVYPALTYLEEVGFASVDNEGNKKRYALSDTGRAHLEANRERVELMLARLQHVARKMAWMRRAMAGDTAQPGADDVAPGDWLPEYVAARTGLKRAMLLRSEMTADEQRRIAAILARATAEIEGTNQQGEQV